jgi:hypothetical protein
MRGHKCAKGTSPCGHSFFACGDFNQRVTEFGITSQDNFFPYFPDFDVRTIEVTYRHTRELNEFAKRIVANIGRDGSAAVLPENVDSEGFKPVFGAASLLPGPRSPSGYQNEFR